MEDTKITLGGFDAILDNMIPNYKQEEKQLNNKEGIEDDDDTLDEIRKKNNDPIANKVKTSKDPDDTDGKQQHKSKEDPTENDDDEDDDEDDDDTKNTKASKSTKKEKQKPDEGTIADNDDPDETEETTITTLFDVLSEKLGFEDSDNKPKDADSLIEYFSEYIKSNSQPNYASEEVQALDEFVHNGGNIKDYFEIDNDLDLEDIDMEDENNQKAVLKEYLKEKGISNEKINKRVTRYEDLGSLEDEATDALEELKEIKINKKEQLLADQKKASEEYANRQREYYTNVVDEIKGLDNIRGIKVPEKDKNVLLNYIFKPEADGKTKYQKDYAKSLKNLIESAYFTMKGDTLLNAAKQEGSKSATDRFKDSLRNNSSVSIKNKNNPQRNSDESIWSSVSRTLRSQD